MLTPVIVKAMVIMDSEKIEKVSSARKIAILTMKTDPSIFSPVSLLAVPAIAVVKNAFT